MPTADVAGRALAESVLVPPPQPFPKTPADHGIAYRDVEFMTSDDVTLRGWLLNEGGEATAVMTHFGYRANRYGYQPDQQPEGSRPYEHEIDFIVVARRLVDAGYTVLMYDLRNHGESDASALGVGTGGVDEGKDVIAAVEFVASQEQTGDHIGLLSYCMGANATFFGMAERPEVFLDAGVQALVAMQPLRNGDFFRALGVDDDVYDAADEHFRSQAGCSLNPEILPQIGQVPVPTRLVQASTDPWTDFRFIEDAFEALGRDANGGKGIEKHLAWIDGTEHRFDGYNYFGDRPELMLDWFGRFVPVAGDG
ncbi:MAG: dienelactone hydrolase family protein [Actinomycetota bacterium]